MANLKAIVQELNDLIRGICGGFLFGILLFYTMEVWWIGSSAESPILLAAIATMLLLVFLLNLTAGSQKTKVINPNRPTRWHILRDDISILRQTLTTARGDRVQIQLDSQR
ncbi:MAG: DUF2391 family protein [Thermosynechococcaceae cyanobacterium]